RSRHGLRAVLRRRGAVGGDDDRSPGRGHPTLGAGRVRDLSLYSLVKSLADNKQLLGMRYAEWCIAAPSLEADIAAAAMGLDDIGHSRVLYGSLRELGSADGMADLARILQDRVDDRLPDPATDWTRWDGPRRRTVPGGIGQATLDMLQGLAEKRYMPASG